MGRGEEGGRTQIVAQTPTAIMVLLGALMVWSGNSSGWIIFIIGVVYGILVAAITGSSDV